MGENIKAVGQGQTSLVKKSQVFAQGRVKLVGEKAEVMEQDQRQVGGGISHGFAHGQSKVGVGKETQVVIQSQADYGWMIQVLAQCSSQAG